MFYDVGARLTFTVSDTIVDHPAYDIGAAMITCDDFYPTGFDGWLPLVGSTLPSGTCNLHVRIQIESTYRPPPGLLEIG